MQQSLGTHPTKPTMHAQVQLRHNKRKSEAIKQLLTSGGSQQGEQLGCDHLSTDDEAASLMAELALAQELRR